MEMDFEITTLRPWDTLTARWAKEAKWHNGHRFARRMGHLILLVEIDYRGKPDAVQIVTTFEGGYRSLEAWDPTTQLGSHTYRGAQTHAEMIGRGRLAGKRTPRSDGRRIYFIEATTSTGRGPIKIGSSTNPLKRVKSMQTANASLLVVLATQAGTTDHETAIHHDLAEHRIRGEWFHPHPDVLAMVGDALPWNPTA